MQIQNETSYITNAETLDSRCKLVTVGTKVTMINQCEICLVSSEMGEFYIDIDKLTKS